MSKRIGGIIENWVFADQFQGPEGVVFGDIYEDDNWPNGMWIRTSVVVSLDEKEGLLETRNTLYRLGKKREGTDA